jgi:hypothetical protein
MGNAETNGYEDRYRVIRLTVIVPRSDRRHQQDKCNHHDSMLYYGRFFDAHCVMDEYSICLANRITTHRHYHVYTRDYLKINDQHLNNRISIENLPVTK